VSLCCLPLSSTSLAQSSSSGSGKPASSSQQAKVESDYLKLNGTNLSYAIEAGPGTMTFQLESLPSEYGVSVKFSDGKGIVCGLQANYSTDKYVPSNTCTLPAKTIGRVWFDAGSTPEYSDQVNREFNAALRAGKSPEYLDLIEAKEQKLREATVVRVTAPNIRPLTVEETVRHFPDLVPPETVVVCKKSASKCETLKIKGNVGGDAI
jgi:hypothetical protein